MISNPVILDTKGLCQHMLHRGTDPDAILKDDGKPCNTAAFGFTNFLEAYLFPILEMAQPWQIVATWDGGNDMRRAWFPDYKKKRSQKEIDPVEAAQSEAMYNMIKNLLAAIGATQVSAKMTEADDLVALLVKSIPGYKVVYTVDADLGQLASDECSVFLRCNLMEGDHKGVPLSLTTLNKSMVGDTSDEYPGIKGFGPKSWEWFMDNFEKDGMEQLEQCVATGDFTVLQEAIDGSDPKIAKGLQKVMDAKSQWELMYKIASLHPDLCYRTQKKKVVRPEWFRRVPCPKRLMSTLTRGGCQDLFGKFEDYMPDQSLVTTDNVDDMLPFFLEQCNSGPVVGFDYETYDSLNHVPFQEAMSKTAGNYVDVLSSKVTGASFTFGENLQYTLYVCVDHAGTGNVSKDILRAMLAAVDPAKLTVQNAAFEVAVSKCDLGVHIESPVDTKILHSYVDEDGLSGLKHMSKLYLNYDQTTYKQTLEDAGVTNMRELTGAQVEQYGCDDAIVTANLAIIFSLATLCEGTWEGIRANEFACVHPLTEAFEKGCNVDIEYLGTLAVEDKKTEVSGMARIRELLQENCSESNLEGAATYYDDVAPFMVSKLKYQDKDQEHIDEKTGAYKEKLIGLSKYIPMTESRKVKDFVPTKKQIGALATTLKFETEFPSPSASGITKWLMAVREEDNPLDMNADLAEDRGEFMALVADAASEISKRKGDDFEEFLTFCHNITNRNAPMEKFGDELNFDSPVQNAGLFYCKLGLPIRVRTKVDPKGMRFKLGHSPSPATDDKALETAIAEDCEGRPWVKEILELVRVVKSCRTRAKLYYTPYPKWVHPRDGMIHPQIVNCGTVTHRPTGKSPNFLQITKKDGGRIRTAIRGYKEDHIIISPDFSGQELRILASECKDEVLLDAYLGAEQKDLHSITAAGIAPIIIKREMPEIITQFDVTQTGLSYEQFCAALEGDDETVAKLLKSIRGDAKAVNFLINYLGGANTLSRNLGITKELAQQFMDSTFKRYPGIKPWQDKIIRFAEIHGYTETAYGTRRHVSDDIVNSDSFIASRAQRQAVNFVIQGCAARILKIVLRTIHERKLMQRTGAVLIAPVYDEVTASVPISAAHDYIAELCEMMTITPPGHAVPMLPEVDLGPTWGQLIELKSTPSKAKIDEALESCRKTLKLVA